MRFRVKACYAPEYYAETRSQSMVKLGLVAEAVEREALAELIHPGSIDVALLRRLHDPTYVDAFLQGIRPLAISQNFPWSEDLRRAVLAMQAGQLVGAELALADGLAANIANGFHHARYHKGGGYCTFNGLALIAQEFPAKRIFVLDCDEHGGNGTEEFTQRLPNLFNYSIHGTRFGCQGCERSVARFIAPVADQPEPYLRAVEEGLHTAWDWGADLLVYQAGVDCHRDDPLTGIGASTEALVQRDTRVFRFCRVRQLPVLFVLAGGYQEMESLVPLHVNTFRAAVGVFRGE